MKRLSWGIVILVSLAVLVFPLANWFVCPGSSTAVVDIARAKCIRDGFPAEKMLTGSVTVDNGMFGFGGKATIEFEADGRLRPDGKRKMEPLTLRVELRRRTNLSSWEVVNIEHEP